MLIFDARIKEYKNGSTIPVMISQEWAFHPTSLVCCIFSSTDKISRRTTNSMNRTRSLATAEAPHIPEPRLITHLDFDFVAYDGYN